METAESLPIGAYDMHIHSAPCIFPRRADDRQAAREATSAGMAEAEIRTMIVDVPERLLNINTLNSPGI